MGSEYGEMASNFVECSMVFGVAFFVGIATS